MKPVLLSAALIIASAGSARAMGINLGWLDCAGQGSYQHTRTFACDTNSGGGHTLVGTFIAPQGMSAVTGYSAVLDLQTSGATLAPWWQLRASLPAGCRPASMSHSADFTSGPSSCFDYWQGGAIGGASAEYPTTAANKARLKAIAALPFGDSRITSIAAGTEVYTFKLTINNAKTVGLGACAGCSDEVCIALNSVLITQTPGAPNGNFMLVNPAVSNHVMWQGWSPADPFQGCPLVVPTRDRTWGAIKAIYR